MPGWFAVTVSMPKPSRSIPRPLKLSMKTSASGISAVSAAA